jgi:hypothetical protein
VFLDAVIFGRKRKKNLEAKIFSIKILNTIRLQEMRLPAGGGGH